MKKYIGLLSLLLLFTVAACASEPGEESVMDSPGSADARPAAEEARPGVVPRSGDAAQADADREISASVRSAIVDDDSLSTSAHNVTIVTTEGEVTLRGSVETDREKSTLEAIARRVPGVRRVNSLLAVRQTGQ